MENKQWIIFKPLSKIAIIVAASIFIGMVRPVQAQQSINLAGIEYRRNITSNSGDTHFYDFRSQATVPISYGNDYFFAALPRYNQTFVENLGFGLSSHVLRRINVPFIFQHKISKHQSIGGILSPGIHSDFKDISGEDWVFIAALFLRNTKNPKFHFRYGLVFSRQVNGMIIIPAVMFNWKPTDRITVDNNDPLSPQFSYKVSTDVTAGFALQRRGGTSKLTENLQSRSIKDVRYDVAPYIDFKLWSPFILRGSVGYTFSRKVQLFKDIDAGSTWNESFKGMDPLKEKNFNGWFFNIGLRLAIHRNR